MKFFYYILLLCTITGHSQNIIIGDSQVPFIDLQTCKAEKSPALWKSGIGVYELTKMVQKYPLSTRVKNVIISIGTNDMYKGNVKDLYRILKYRFPYATFYVVPGSWGWGKVKRITAKELNSYYKKHEAEGAIILPVAIGLGDPHRNKPSYVLIGQYLDEILTNN
jgi:hypothetical protein